MPRYRPPPPPAVAPPPPAGSVEPQQQQQQQLLVNMAGQPVLSVSPQAQYKLSGKL